MKTKPKSDRHKPAKLVRINDRLAAATLKLAERNATTVPQEINRALREYLEREKFWPPND